jgi:hypothetical protein
MLPDIRPLISTGLLLVQRNGLGGVIGMRPKGADRSGDNAVNDLL